MTRAFVAVSPPDAVLDAVAERTASLAIPGRLTTRAQWHITLQFLGDRADVDALTAALTGLEVSGGPARIGGAGAFPNARRGRVLWFGLASGVDVLTRLADAVATRTALLGHERDETPYRPHLTLARYRVPTDLRRAMTDLGNDAVGPEWRVDAISVFESDTRAEGARYVERAVIALAG